MGAGAGAEVGAGVGALLTIVMRTEIECTCFPIRTGVEIRLETTGLVTEETGDTEGI